MATETWGTGAEVDNAITVYGSPERDTTFISPPVYGESWATLLSGAGNGVGSSIAPSVYCGGYPGSAEFWKKMEKCIFVADTSGLSAETINSATVGIYVIGAQEGDAGYSIGLYGASPANEASIAAADYNNIDGSWADPKTLASLTGNAWHTFTIPAVNIDKSGNTCFAIIYTAHGGWNWQGGGLISASAIKLSVTYNAAPATDLASKKGLAYADLANAKGLDRADLSYLKGVAL